MQAEKRDYYIYNTMSRTKELFRPVVPGMVGLYVCGPTVYGDAHLGHARPAITFDVLTRYFRYMGYKVRYVRNITDVGHLEHDSDDGEDKIAKKAKMEQLEPMEVAQECTIKFHKAMEKLNTLPPSIEPHASGHIIEQIQLIQQILDHGFAYISNGSVYFDVAAYNRKFHYGVLSGRNLEDILTNTRELDGSGDKHSSVDFALWKKASPEHIMRWPSPWSDGFPGWHLECSAMSAKYLGEEFDIHGGGMDLLFPHHECELAQNCASRGKGGVHYWMHNNMITINGQKMGKSLGNFITLDELFNGTHKLLQQPYSPMTVRFFILQAHYRSTLDFSNEALQAAEKGLKRIMQASKDVEKLAVSNKLPCDKSKVTDELVQLKEKVFEALSDDLNTPIALSHLFDAVRIVNSVKDGSIAITEADKSVLRTLLIDVVENVLGLKSEFAGEQNRDSAVIEKLMEMILAERAQAKADKDWAKSDKIRDELAGAGVKIKDTKNGVEWSI